MWFEKHVLEEPGGAAEVDEAGRDAVVDGGIDVEESGGGGEADCCVLVGLLDDFSGQGDGIELDPVSLRAEDVLLGGA